MKKAFDIFKGVLFKFCYLFTFITIGNVLIYPEKASRISDVSYYIFLIAFAISLYILQIYEKKRKEK
jgi:hypothetical protein